MKHVSSVIAVSGHESNDPTHGRMLAREGVWLGTGAKIVYGLGATVESVTSSTINNFLLFYLTAVCGLSGSRAGAALLAALLLDAIVDPVIGSVSDNTRSRWGRRRPFMLAATLPVGVSIGLLFSVPANCSGWGLFIYALFAVLLVRFGQSLFHVPYTALGAELTDDYHERSVVAGYRWLFNMLAMIMPFVLGFSMFLKGSALLQRSAYVPFGWSCGALTTIVALVCSSGTLEPRRRIDDQARGQERMWTRLRHEAKDAVRNPSFRILFAAMAIFLVAYGASISLALYVNKFFWRLPDSLIEAISIALPCGSLLGIPLVAYAGRRVEKRSVALAGIALFCLGQAVLPLLRVAGLLPNGPLLYGLLILNAGLSGMGMIATAITCQSMMVDAVDEHELLFNARHEGLYFAGLSFAAKAAAGMGGAIGGGALDLIGFPVALASRGPEPHISSRTIVELGLIQGPGAGVLISLCIVLLLRYRIDRPAHSRMQAELQKRRAMRGCSAKKGI